MRMNSHTSQKDEEVTDLLDLTQYEEALSKVDSGKFEILDMGGIKVNWSDPLGRRSAPRYSMKVNVIISNCYRAFRSQVENISMTGFLLRDFLPDDCLKGSFDIVVVEDTDSETKSYMSFRGHAVRTNPKSNRVIFDLVTKDSAARLSHLVKDLKPVV